MDAHNMRLRFRDLTEQSDAIKAALKPMQDQVDALNDHIAAKQAELRPLVTELLEKKRPLVEIENKRAALSRALGRQTGL
jgi:predicted  nucleic acid-binding Zn-ribbon protein